MKTLPPSVRDELARGWGLDPLRLAFLGGGQDWSDGTLYTAAAPGSGDELVLKILDFPEEDQEALERAEDRIRFVRFFGDRGCRIITPLPSLNGSMFEVRREEGRRFLAYAYQKVPGLPLGRHAPSMKSGAYYRAIGAELGRLHAAWESRGSVIRPDGTGTESAALKGWRDEMAFFRVWCQDDEVKTVWDRLRQALEGLDVAPAGYGFIHNDAHAGNFLDSDPSSEPALTVIDFDVANYHWYLNDCATALYSFSILATGGIETEIRPAVGLMNRASALFWEGYGLHKDPDTLELERLDLFLQYRRCLLFMPFQEQTARDPVWRRRWIDRILEADRRLFPERG